MRTDDPRAVPRILRIIRLEPGDTTVELTDQEIALGAVSYLFKSGPGFATVTRRLFVSAEQVMQSNFGTQQAMDAFQVSPDGWDTMRAKAKRLLEIRRVMGALDKLEKDIAP